MPGLIQQSVRQLADETVVANNEASGNVVGPCDWTDAKTYTFTPAASCLLICKFTLDYQSGSNVYGNARVLLDSVPIFVSGVQNVSSPDLTRQFAIVISGGARTLKFQIADSQSCTWKISGIYLGYVNLSDLASGSQSTTGQNVTNGSTSTLVNQGFTAPATRKTPLGNIKNYNAQVLILCDCDVHKNLFRNNGESDTSDRINWKLYINGIRTDWTEKGGTSECGTDYQTTSNLGYGEGICGRYWKSVEAGTAVTVRVDAYNNATGGTRTCNVYVYVVWSPWVLGPNTDHEPIDLDVSQFSTVYLELEPLMADPDKYLNIGKARAISFGSATDFYYSAHGTGLLNASYSFELIEAAGMLVFAYGKDGCISHIGVDER